MCSSQARCRFLTCKANMACYCTRTEECQRAANVLVSWNNKPASESIPQFKDVVVPAVNTLLDEGNQASKDLEVFLRNSFEQVPHPSFHPVPPFFFHPVPCYWLPVSFRRPNQSCLTQQKGNVMTAPCKRQMPLA